MEIAEDLGSVGNNWVNIPARSRRCSTSKGKVNKEIQQGLMRTGMVRFGAIIPRLRRVVRQAAQDWANAPNCWLRVRNRKWTALKSWKTWWRRWRWRCATHCAQTNCPSSAAQPVNRTLAITLSCGARGRSWALELGDDGAGLNFNVIRLKAKKRVCCCPVNRRPKTN